ncbi:transcription activator acu-15 [Fusarium heterosporum]|uniref:Transcription activator acu-15 n=1 Tax=Fusarium heterosporum TaxID=42747 RepID=A0A8H5TUC5_FUSHE|nr:transcription activator acu-15 [Fusarium heterosporum]
MSISQAQILTPSSSTATESIENSTNARRVTAMGTTTSEEDVGHHRHTSEAFYGSSSADSFLKETCGTAIPSSNHLPHPQTCTIKSTFLYSDVHKFALPPRRLADHLLERYFQRIYWLYPVFNKQAFDHAYESLWLPSGQCPSLDEYRGLGLGEDASTVSFFSALNAIFALGCIFSDLSMTAKKAAYEVFFSRCKDKVNLELLDINDLSVVQTLLLVALVLQGTSFPDRCWNTTGLACRVAQGLGLHSLLPYNREESRVQATRRQPTICEIENVEDFDQIKLQFQTETVRLSIILDNLLSRVYKPWQCKLAQDDQTTGSRTETGNQSMDAFSEIQGRLREFELRLPNYLSWNKPLLTETIAPYDATILAIQRDVLHSRYTYLQVMLYRPILTQLLALDTSHGANDDLHSSFKHDGAKACIRSSIKLVDLVHKTIRTETAEAWWWNSLYACTASLVLMTSRLCPSLWATLDRVAVVEALDRCHAVLEVISSFSLSIRKSFNLLTKMHETIMRRQQARDISDAYSQESQRNGLLDTLLEPDLSLQNALTTSFPFDPDTIVFPYWEAANLGG